MKRRIPVMAVALLLVGGLAWFLHAKSRHPDAHLLQLYGNVDIREVNLGFRVSGKLSEVCYDEGDAVQSGAVLARLDNEPYRRETQQAKAQVEAFQARVQLLEAGNRPQEVAQANAVGHEREVTAANAERLFKRQEELLSSKAVAVQDRDDAEARFREAEARLRSAREQLGLLQAGFRAEEIAQARADLGRAEAALAASELRFDDTVLKAPADGIILTRTQEPGAILSAGTTVLTLSLRRPVWVRAYLQEPDLGRVRPGAPVRVYTDSRPNRPYSGQIGFISPRAEFTPKNVETTELRTSLVYRLRIVMNDSDEDLRQGMPVTIKVPLP